MTLQLLLTLILALNVAWAPYKDKYFSPEKVDLAPYIESLEDAYVELGVPYSKEIYFEYRPFPVRVLGATKTRGDGSCMQTVALNTTLRIPSHPLYGSPEPIATLAHEVAHVYQGAGCMDSAMAAESNAEVGMFLSLAYLAETDDNAKAALIYELRREVILAALNLSKQQGLGADIVLNIVDLTDVERDYFEAWYNRSDLRYYSTLYWTTALAKIMAEMEDGDKTDIYCSLSLGTYREGPKLGPVCLNGESFTNFMKELTK